MKIDTENVDQKMIGMFWQYGQEVVVEKVCLKVYLKGQILQEKNKKEEEEE